MLFFFLTFPFQTLQALTKTFVCISYCYKSSEVLEFLHLLACDWMAYLQGEWTLLDSYNSYITKLPSI